MQTNKTVDCENLVQNNQISVAKHSVRPNRHLNKMCLLKPTDTTDIVFSNQTDKLFKKQQSLHPSKSTPVMGKYNLRKKSVQTRSDIKKPNQQTCDKHLRGLKDEQSRPKKRNAQLSKYKRKNANARERDRVKGINEAFEILKSILPKDIVEQKADDKLTKIATLRTAVRYIAGLSELINKTNDSLVTEEDNNQMDTDQLNSNLEQKANSKMDTLPDISFISSDELSILSYISDEETGEHLNDETVLIRPSLECSNLSNNLSSDLSNESNAVTHRTTGSSTHHLNSLLSEISCEATDSTLVKLNETDTLINDNQLNNTYLINSSQMVNVTNQLNQTYDLNGNQTYDIQSAPSDHQTAILHNLSFTTPTIRNVQSSNLSRFYVSQTPSSVRTNLDSGFKATNEIVLQDSNNNNQLANRPKNVIASTPLLNNHDHNLLVNLNNQLQSSLFSPIKGDENQATNYVSMKSASTDDGLFGSVSEDIENDNFYSAFQATDDFDLIL